MLQIDHVYEFFYKNIFNNFQIWSLPSGVPKLGPIENDHDFNVFTPSLKCNKKIFFYDQEPLLQEMVEKYVNHYLHFQKYSIEELKEKYNLNDDEFQYYLEDANRAYKLPACICVSEHSDYIDKLVKTHDMKKLYYFFHGFAALDWYRGYYALNHNKSIVKKQKDFITLNRLIAGDRSYRSYFISQLVKHNLSNKGLISYNVSDADTDWRDEVSDSKSKLSEHAKTEIEENLSDIFKIIIDSNKVHGSASANIFRNNYDYGSEDQDCFWHIVTETVFYYDKLHLTEKIFKPIVSKQPFMLLAAPGNLEYLRSYGFKTFDGIIDESYDHIQDNDQRIDSVVKQIKWYCDLSDQDKFEIQRLIAPTVEHNFHHFYGEFKNIIIDELLTNCKNLFKEIDYKETVDYNTIRKLLLN